MPELPEVETARRNLARWAAGRRVQAVHLPDAAAVRTSLSTHPKDVDPHGQVALHALVGATAQAPVRRGKRLGWGFEGSDTAFLLHLGMTGKWVRRPPGHDVRFARLGIELRDAVLWFVDPRRFGCLSPVPRGMLASALVYGLGPDALDTPLDGPALRQALQSRSSIKAVLLDQARLAGLGNIQAAEALWRARVHPARRADALDDAAWARLAEGIVGTLTDTLIAFEAEEVTYLSEGGEAGFAVYGRVDEPCLRCGEPIEALQVAGRVSPCCPVCQPC